MSACASTCWASSPCVVQSFLRLIVDERLGFVREDDGARVGLDSDRADVGETRSLQVVAHGREDRAEVSCVFAAEHDDGTRLCAIHALSEVELHCGVVGSGLGRLVDRYCLRVHYASCVALVG